QAEDGIRDFHVTGVQTCALPISLAIDPANLRISLRLQDKFFGFSSLRYAAARTPTRGTAELARFGNDVGRVSYLNAKDVTGFPRSEERRVGKEWRSTWATDQEKK